MNLQSIIAFVSLLSIVFGLALENGGTTTSVSVTTVWYTTTQPGGAVQTLPSIYSQTFMMTYSTATQAAQSGGIESISSIGGIRSYQQTTVNGGDKVANVYTGFMGLLVLGLAII